MGGDSNPKDLLLLEFFMRVLFFHSIKIENECNRYH